MHPALRRSRRANIALVKRLLYLEGGRPRRWLGQSFLVDPLGFKIFLGALQRVGGSWWLEIGLGPGLLTCEAQSMVSPIVGYEIDLAMARAAARLCSGSGRVLIVHGDGLQALSAWRGPVYSNTPYSLTSRIISGAARNNRVPVAVLGMQHELALRVLARPGTRDYGRLSVLTQLFFRAEYAGFLRRDWFYPRPRVDGSVIIMRRKMNWSRELEGFEEFTACLFHQRNRKARKVVRTCTGGSIDDPDLERVRIRDLSPETVLEVFLRWKNLSRLGG